MKRLASLRPRSLEEMAGNGTLGASELAGAAARGDMPPPNFFIVGPPGSGKTAAAALLARALAVNPRSLAHARHVRECVGHTDGRETVRPSSLSREAVRPSSLSREAVGPSSLSRAADAASAEADVLNAAVLRVSMVDLSIDYVVHTVFPFLRRSPPRERTLAADAVVAPDSAAGADADAAAVAAKGAQADERVRRTWKVVVMDGLEMASRVVQDALRVELEKTLEDTRFVFTARSVDAITAPLLSRCKLFTLEPPAHAALARSLVRMFGEAALPTSHAALIAAAARGDFRVALLHGVLATAAATTPPAPPSSALPTATTGPLREHGGLGLERKEREEGPERPRLRGPAPVIEDVLRSARRESFVVRELLAACVLGEAAEALRLGAEYAAGGGGVYDLLAAGVDFYALDPPSAQVAAAAAALRPDWKLAGIDAIARVSLRMRDAPATPLQLMAAVAELLRNTPLPELPRSTPLPELPRSTPLPGNTQLP